MEATNRFKGFDLVSSVPEEPQTEVCNIVQEAVNTTIPKKKKSKGGIYPTELRFPKNSMERQEDLPQ